jgi:hypothetical protein
LRLSIESRGSDSTVKLSWLARRVPSKPGKLVHIRQGGEMELTGRMDIMAATSKQMEAGYKKVHRWCQFEISQFTKEGQLDVSPLLRQALQRLKSRPALIE